MNSDPFPGAGLGRFSNAHALDTLYRAAQGADAGEHAPPSPLVGEDSKARLAEGGAMGGRLGEGGEHGAARCTFPDCDCHDGDCAADPLPAAAKPLSLVPAILTGLSIPALVFLIGWLLHNTSWGN